MSKLPLPWPFLVLLTLALAGCDSSDGVLGSPGDDDDDDTVGDDDDTSDDDDAVAPSEPCDRFFSKGEVGQDFAVHRYTEGGFEEVRLDPEGEGTVWSTVVADFSGDGDLDILAQRSIDWPDDIAVHLFTGECDGEFSDALADGVGGVDLDGLGADIYTAADLDGDGDQDLIGWTWYAGSGLVWLNSGDGSSWDHLRGEGDVAPPFQLQVWNADENPRVTVTSSPVDLTDDGVVDLLECHNWAASPTECRVHVGLGDGRFSSDGPEFALDRLVNGLAVADIDDDGLLEFVGGLDDDGDAGQAWLWEIDEAGDLPSGAGVPLFDVNPEAESDADDEPGYGWLYPWDWTGDGRVDLLATTLNGNNSAEMQLRMARNEGAAGFALIGLGSTWHGFGGNNIFMQDFVGVPPSQ